MNEKILVIEDDASINEMLKNYLQKEGFIVATAFDGKDGLSKFLSSDFNLILMDIMMPKLDGIETMKLIREKSSIPILLMSAKDSDVDKVIGLGFGADDYIAKPFSLIEVSARIKAAIRRSTKYSNNDGSIEVSEARIIQVKDLSIDLHNFSVKKKDQVIQLTSKEFDILKLFCKNPNRVYTKAQIYSLVWKDDYYGDENVINVHMSRLREKLEDNPSSPEYIKTIWGIGYKMDTY
jgi:DNA-binding response OmpR family regulator